MKSISADSLTLPVLIPAGHKMLRGDFVNPDRAEGLVLFVRVDGKYGDYPYDRKMSALFGKHRLASLLIDLPADDKTPLPELIDMLGHVVDWIRRETPIARLPLGCFAVSLGAAVAIGLATRYDAGIQGIVSCDGRFDLAMENLPRIKLPILLLSGNDDRIKNCNQTALKQIRSEASFNVIPHASHVFENVRAVEEAGQLASLWFAGHLNNIPA